MAIAGTRPPVRCPGCAREYDPALFEHGRTLHCACGRRVGGAPLPAPDPEDHRPRFFADAMLGRLARWLRVLGYDTAWRAHIADEDLVRSAAAEGRIVLTRDRRMLEEWRYEGIHLVEAESPREQLAEVAAAFRLVEGARLFDRCVRCNERLDAVAPGSVATDVPERIRREHGRFRRCGACGRVYWRGSHTRRMREALGAILGLDARALDAMEAESRGEGPAGT
ncbi:MAG: Mut7-C RNAse domain-containing protein [Myxococcota bacterium]